MLLIHLISGVSVDCPNVIKLAMQMKMNTSQPSIMSQLNADCCTAQGVTCDSSTRVTQIFWVSLSPPLTGIINGTLLPPFLTGLRLTNNKLTGSIPRMWPSGLLGLDISRNPLNCVSPGPWPSSLILLHLNGLSCTGSAGLFPSNLQELFLGWFGDYSRKTNFLVL